MMSLKILLFIALGGASGALLRSAVTVNLPWNAHEGFPLATLLVNLAGCFLIGLSWSALSHLDDALKGLIIAGFLGSLTTFSTYGMDTIRLLEEGRIATALAYVLASTTIGLTLVFIGLRAGTTFTH